MADTMFGQDPALLQQEIQQKQQANYQANVQGSPFEMMQAAGNQAGGMLGNALGSAMGYQDPRMADAMLDKQILQKSIEDAKTAGVDVNDPMAFGKVYATNQMNAGRPQKAYAVIQQMQGMAKQQAETTQLGSKSKLEEAQAIKALREDSGPAHMSDMGKYQYELDKVNTALDQDPTNPRLQAMKTNYEAKINRFSQGDKTVLEKNIEMLRNKYGFPEDVAVGLQTGSLAIVPTADGGVKILDKRDILSGRKGASVWESGQKGALPVSQVATSQAPYSQFQQQPTLPGEIGGTPGYKPQERLDKAVVDIGQDLEKAKTTDQKNTIQGVMQQFDSLKERLGKVPGVGHVVGGLPTWMVPSQEGRQLRDSLQQAFNITLKDRSGAAVTPQEMKRLQQEFASGAFRTEDDMRAALQRLNDIINKHEQGLINTYPEEARVEFLKRTNRTWEVKTPIDVRVAYKAGKMSREEAKSVLADMDREGIK